jgi:SAM-dependent methyltransferase
VEEARRVMKLLPLLSEVARDHSQHSHLPLRILDLGCGRGWLTHIASAYGECLGIDPVRPVIDHARACFPHLRFEPGTARDLLTARGGGEFDVVIASEVIEHVPPAERHAFVRDIGGLLAARGAALVSSDRGELYQRWATSGATQQPEEHWLTERELRELFCLNGFHVIGHDRAYYGARGLSWFHEAVADRRVRKALGTLGQRWLLEGMRYLAAECQVWLFRRAQA